MNKSNIYLIGYRCTGKTGAGRLLAEAIEFSFADTDDIFVKRSGLFVSEYVILNGWKSFRRLESEIIAELSEKEKTVVATGGGVVLDPENVRAMKENGRIIWLRASWETVYRRMAVDPLTEDMRPALTTLSTADEIRQTLVRRESLYRSAMNAEVHTDDTAMVDVCRRIMKLLEAEDTM